MSSTEGRRVHLQPAYVLHHRPYRDTSRILELFTRDFGRVTVFARGARGGRNKSGSLMSVLQPFNRLLVSWTGQGEAGQLTSAEFDGAFAIMPPDQLVNGYYLNELLLKLFARHDGHADVFALYAATIDALKQSSESIAAPVHLMSGSPNAAKRSEARDLPCARGIGAFSPARSLRIFEKRLLDALGYGLVLDVDALTHEAVDPTRMYHYRLDQGAVRALDVAEGSLVFQGSSLLSLAREELATPTVLTDARRLLRAALERCLDGRELKSRQVLLALRRTNPTST